MKHLKRSVLLAAGLLIVAAGSWYVYRQFQRQTAPVIQNSQHQTTPKIVAGTKTQRIDQDLFAFEAPADWRFIKHDSQPYSLYSYHSTQTNADNRYLDIYIDRIPQALAVNKVVAVRWQAGTLTHGQVSDNCTTFAGPAIQATGTAKQLSVMASYDGVEFYCDNDTTTRNVVGTSSPGGINRVAVSGAQTGQHPVFFVYTDNNYSPDYTIFYKMLETFTVK